MILLVCGGRNYADQEQIRDVLDGVHAKEPITMLVHGGAKGADQRAGAWAKLAGVSTLVFPAKWGTHGKRAGILRNIEMLNYLMHRAMLRDSVLVIAFPGGRGTAHMVKTTKAAGLPITEVPDMTGYA